MIAGRDDYEWARELVRTRQLQERCPVLFSPVHGELELEPLAAWVLEDRLPVRVQVQLHKLIWGAETRGVSRRPRVARDVPRFVARPSARRYNPAPGRSPF